MSMLTDPDNNQSDVLSCLHCRLMVELVKEEGDKVEETTEQVLGKLCYAIHIDEEEEDDDPMLCYIDDDDDVAE